MFYKKYIDSFSKDPAHLQNIIESTTKSNFVVVQNYPIADLAVQIPLFLYEKNLIKNNFFCANQTTYSTVSLAYVCTKIIAKPDTVNYAYDLDYVCNKNCKITFGTTNYLLTKILANSTSYKKTGLPWFCDTIMFNQIELASKEITTCILLLIEAHDFWNLNNHLEKPPNIICTMFGENYTNTNVIEIFPKNCNFVSFPQKILEVEEIYDCSACNLDIESENRYLRAADLINQYHNSNYPGTYVVLSPGIQETKYISSKIRNVVKNCQIFLINDNTDWADLSKVVNYKETNCRSIIITHLTTECPIILNQASLIIDTFVHKILTKTDNFYSFDTEWSCVKNIRKRKNLFNQNSNKIYLILQSKIFCQDLEIPTKSVNSTETFAETDFLKLIEYNLDPKLVYKNILPESIIDNYLHNLKKLNLIIKKEKACNLTSMGNFCVNFPLEIKKSIMLYYLPKNNLSTLYHLSVICTVNNYTGNLFNYPKKNINEDDYLYLMRKDDAIQVLEDKFGGYSSLDTIFRIWIKIFLEINPFYLTDLRNFCKKNNLNFSFFKEVSFLIKKCMHILQTLNYTLFMNKFPLKNLPVYLRNPNYAKLSETFYNLLQITHKDCETVIFNKHHGEMVALCNNLKHKIDNQSIYLADLGNNQTKVYYAIVKNYKTKNKKTTRIINVFHCVPDSNENQRIFFSDTETELDVELDVDLGTDP